MLPFSTRVKATKPCPWLIQELIREMRKRDQLKHNRRFDDYKKQRNYVLNLVQKAKNTYISKLVKDNRDTSSIWKAINSITWKKTPRPATCQQVISPLTALTTISSLCPPNCFIPWKKAQAMAVIYILPPWLTSAGKSEDPLVHFIYHYSLFMK